MKRYRNRIRVFRKLAVVLTVTFAVSVAAPPIRFSHVAATAQGTQGILQVFPVPGEAYPWEGTWGSVNTFDGNKLTTIPIIGWTAKGGMPVNFALHHNSSSNASGEIGWDWRHSFRITLASDIFIDGMRITWGDGRSYVYADNFDGTFDSPVGIHDTLVSIGNPITSYVLTKKNQVKYTFTNPNGTLWVCTSIKDRNNNTITINWNASNNVSTIVDPTSRTITLNYTSGRISSIVSPQSRTWSLSYNGSTELSQITLPTVSSNSYNLQFGYDTSHRITSYTDARSKVWTYFYNTNSSTAWEKDPYLNQTSYTYNTNQTVITDPNSKVTKHNYSSGKLTSIQDPLLYTESFQYDSANNVWRHTDKRGKLWDSTFDTKGNRLTLTDPLLHVTTWTWNTFNDPLSITCDLGHQTVHTYNASGNRTKTELKDAVGTVISTTTYVPNTDGTLQSKTDSNSHQTLYGYDANGHPNRVETPNGRVTEYTNNTLGVVTQRKDAMLRTTNYSPDEWNRIIATDYPTGTDPAFTFDGNSNLIAWSDSTGSWTRSFDDANRILTEKLNTVTQCSYVYDATGKKGLLSSITDESGRTVTYNYTNRNQLSSVVDSGGTASYSYDPDGRELQCTLQNGAYSVNVFDDAGRLSSVTHKNSAGTTLNSFTYAYQDDNLRTSCTEASGDVVSYGYDGAHRLTSESRTGTNAYSRSYVLDGVGNRTSQTVGGTTTNFTINNDDELTATSGGFVNSYSYNANGEQTGRTLSGTSYTLSYDFDGQLTGISGGATVSFAYDALGRRHSRTAGGTTTRYIRGPGGILLEKQGSTYVRTYTHGNSQVRLGSEYPMYDGAGSERTVTNGSQTVTGTITFEGFGQTIATTGSSGNPYMFKGAWGYRNDGDAGLHHVGARYYDVQVGRFITRDTFLSEHPYLYCEHDPVNNADPTGHIFWGLVISLVIAAVIDTGCDCPGPPIGGVGKRFRFGNPKDRPGGGGIPGWDPPRGNPSTPAPGPIGPPPGRGRPMQPLNPDGTPGNTPYRPPLGNDADHPYFDQFPLSPMG